MSLWTLLTLRANIVDYIKNTQIGITVPITLQILLSVFSKIMVSSLYNVTLYVVM